MNQLVCEPWFKQSKGKMEDRDNQRYLNTAWKFDNLKEMFVYLWDYCILVILKGFFIFLQYLQTHVWIILYDEVDLLGNNWVTIVVGVTGRVRVGIDELQQTSIDNG